ncbi:MAG: Ni/Fe hydrogenase subunit alpha [Armatimonadota bacterium]
MAKTIIIDPVTRIEGHSKITLFADDQGNIVDAQFHVTQFRGFEKFCEGRPYTEMPALMARICGICPVSHLLCSAKATDALLAVDIPHTAANLRRIMNFAQLVQSHALSFFHLSAPDFMLGFDSDPKTRNILGLAAAHPELAKDGIRLRSIGQKIISMLGNKSVHPHWSVPGGVGQGLTTEGSDTIKVMLDEALAIALRTIGWFKIAQSQFVDEIAVMANFSSLFVGLTGYDGLWDTYDGILRVGNAKGEIIDEVVDPMNYADVIGEAVEPWTYLKFPFYAPMGYPDGMYRVGPMARLAVCDGFGTPLADQEWAEYRELTRGASTSSFHNHLARLVEIIGAIERMQVILADPETTCMAHLRATAEPSRNEGVGFLEAPRGTLVHHYRIDNNGLMNYCNLIIATGHNNLAMNKGILQAAKRFVKVDDIKEGALNRVEAVIRCYDPCLSCSTHALGQMPIVMEIKSQDGTLLRTIER